MVGGSWLKQHNFVKFFIHIFQQNLVTECIFYSFTSQQSLRGIATVSDFAE